MLTKLSPEVLHLVARQLPGADLKSMSLVSVYIRRAVIRSLWNSITIRPSDEYDLHDITTEGFPHLYIPHVSELHFAAPLELGSTGCPHSYGSWKERGKFFERLDQRAKSFLDKFEKTKLRSFSWYRGCCVPETILGEDGLLARMHPSLESLRLVVDPKCRFFYQRSRFTDHGNMGLSSFRNLKSICWKGSMINSHHLLGTVIEKNADHLDHLELDLLYTDGDFLRARVHVQRHEGDNDPGYFGKILKLHEHTVQPIFQSLTSLVLTNVSLGPAMVGMINFEVLRSLTLRVFPGWARFTQRIVKTRPPVRLKTLELHHGLSAPVKNSQLKVEKFIDVCGGLEELFLNLPKPDDARSIWKHIARHEASLKRLVLHYRTKERHPHGFSEQETGLPSLGLTEHGNTIYYPPEPNPLQELKLECVSLCCFPELTELMLETSSSLASLKFAHIRKASFDYRPPNPITGERASPQIPTPLLWFAEWAFGPDGPPLLEAVAYGKFSHRGWAHADNLILCPTRDWFRTVPRDGREWVDIVAKYRNVLEACPVDPLLQ